ncbi:MAG: protein translocase subunit SecF [Candidatus Lambdaproteobacteria bacterium]|nr:protein translocase subunit SecF [Candidatus Lambdaproteobacteria bacterium]
MRLVPDDLNINFISHKWISLSASSAVILLGVIAYFLMGGFNYGVDFRGGSVVQIQFTKTHDLAEIRQVLAGGNLGTFDLQNFGDPAENEFLIALPEIEETVKEETPANRVRNLLTAAYPDVNIRRVESVGPRVGDELKTAAFEAILFSVFAILIYVWLRFQWRFSVGTVLALVHDILIVLAAFVVTQKEITLAVVAAVLTVAGYSVNDTIVIFDRVRENQRKFQKKNSLEIFNSSLNETLSRTILTAGTTLVVLVAIFFLGGDIIHDFAFALLLGITVGTYSSIYIAAPLSYLLQQRFPPRSK